MRFLGLLERRIEQLIEGLFTRWAGQSVQPFQVRRQLLREMERGAAGGPRTLVLPNTYGVRLHPRDFAPYRDDAAALTREFVDALHARAGELGGRFDGPVEIAITAADDVPPGEVHVDARVRPIEAREAPPAPSESEPPRQAQVADVPRLRLLSDTSGAEPREFPLEQAATTIGRDAGHTIVLADPSVSRTHACIEFGPAGATIVDLGSTNGTMLNGRPLGRDRALLRGGDRVQIGALVLEYREPQSPAPNPS